MIKQPDILGIIPARGGSKGVPRKNIRQIAGKPLIAWAIEAARESIMLSTFVVSTEDKEIAEIAGDWGAMVVPRPRELAGDWTPMAPVVQHVLLFMEGVEGAARYDYVCLLQPTSPQRTGRNIDDALTLLCNSKADSVISVYQVEDQHPARMYVLSIDGYLLPYSEPDARAYTDGLRQNLPKVYHRNGAIYACRAALVRKECEIMGKVVLGYLMPRSCSGNIDDEMDLLVVERMLKKQYGLE